MKLILAENSTEAIRFARDHDLNAKDYFIVYGVRSLEGLRFRYEDVIRVPGWSKRDDIEEIEDRILRTHVAMSYLEGVCTYGTELH